MLVITNSAAGGSDDDLVKAAAAELGGADVAHCSSPRSWTTRWSSGTTPWSPRAGTAACTRWPTRCTGGASWPSGPSG
ncbi:hypothetical protein ACFQXA_13410 [Nocardiopsis composta]